MKYLKSCVWMSLTLLFFPVSTPAMSVADVCTIFQEDFSGLSSNEWQFYGNIRMQNSGLNVQNTPSGSISMAETRFMPFDPFVVDVDVTANIQDSDGAFGIYPYTNGDMFLDVNGDVADGLGLAVFPANGELYFLYWNPLEGAWKTIGPYSLPASVNSVGLSFGDNAIGIRINKADTGYEISGAYTLASSVIDTLLIFGTGWNSSFIFDNVCSDPAGAATPGYGVPTLTGNLDLVIPVLRLGDQFLEVQFEYIPDPDTILFKVTDYGFLQGSAWQNPSFLSPSLELFIPSLDISGTPFWINMIYDTARSTEGLIIFKVESFGVAGGAESSFSATGTAKTNAGLNLATLSGAKIFVPEGAVGPTSSGEDGTMVFSIEKDTQLNPSLPQGQQRVSDVYRFGPGGFVFQQAVTVTIPLTGPQSIENAVLYRIDESTGALEALSGVYDPNTRTITGQTTHFSPLFAASEPIGQISAGAIRLDNSGAPLYTWRNVCPSRILEYYYPTSSDFRGSASVSPDGCHSGWCNQIDYIVPQGRYEICVETWSRRFQSDLPRLEGHKILPEIVNVDQPYYTNNPQSISETLRLGNLTMNQPGPCPCSSTPTPSAGTGDLTITLVWHSSTPVDLDLWVIEPDGNVISYEDPVSGSGGKLDLDNQCDEYIAGQPENIFWSEPPAGTYKVRVNWYDICDAPLSSTRYEVRVVNQGVSKTYTGTIHADATVDVVNISVD